MMHGKATTVILAALLATALAPSALASNEIGIGNAIIQAALAGAEIDDVLSNDADVYQGGGDGHAVATCQWVVAANTIILNVAAIEALGLISDEDNISFPGDNFNGGARLLQDEIIDREFHEDNATASCEQDFGAILVAVQTENGWGDPAPLAAEASWLSDGLTSPGFFNGNGLGGGGFGGLGGGNIVLQAAVAEMSIDDLLENDFYIEQGYGGDGHAAANCQAIIGVNTLVVNAALASFEAGIEDDDTIAGPPIIIGPPVIAEPIRTQQVTEIDGDPDTLDSAHADCRQHATSVTIVVGDDVPTIPPQS